MRQFIRLVALSILLSTALFWYTQGAHTGWSQNYTTRMEVDPVTEIEYPVKTGNFVPGVDFLGLSALVAVIVFGSSFLFRRRLPREIKLESETAQREDPDESRTDETEQTNKQDQDREETDPNEEEEKRLT